MMEHRRCNRAVAKSASQLRGSAAHFPVRHTRTDNTGARSSRTATGYAVSFAILLFALRHAGVFDPDGHHGFLVLCRRAVDSVGNLEAGKHPPKGCELPVQMRSLTDEYKEMCGSAIGFVAAGHRHDSA